MMMARSGTETFNLIFKLINNAYLGIIIIPNKNLLLYLIKNYLGVSYSRPLSHVWLLLALFICFLFLSFLFT